MSKPAASAPTTEFQPVDEEAEIHSLLRDGVRGLAAVKVWTKSEETPFNCSLCHYSKAESRFHVSPPAGFDFRGFMDNLAKERIDEVFFSISLTRASIFLKARFVGFERSVLQFAIPKKIFKVQRRHEMRYVVQEGYSLKVQFVDPLFDDQKMTKSVYDISAGGLSFLVTENEALVFPVEMKIKKMEFHLGTQKVEADGEVRHCRAFVHPRVPAKKDLFRVGVRFINLRKGTAQMIASYVFEEARKFFARMD